MTALPSIQPPARTPPAAMAGGRATPSPAAEDFGAAFAATAATAAPGRQNPAAPGTPLPAKADDDDPSDTGDGAASRDPSATLLQAIDPDPARAMAALFALPTDGGGTAATATAPSTPSSPSPRLGDAAPLPNALTGGLPSFGNAPVAMAAALAGQVPDQDVTASMPRQAVPAAPASIAPLDPAQPVSPASLMEATSVRATAWSTPLAATLPAATPAGVTLPAGTSATATSSIGIPLIPTAAVAPALVVAAPTIDPTDTGPGATPAGRAVAASPTISRTDPDHGAATLVRIAASAAGGPGAAEADRPAPRRFGWGEASAAPATATTAPIVTVAAADQPALDFADRRWPGAMVDRIEQLRDAADAADTRIRVVPDALGPIDVAVRQNGGVLDISFTAAHETTRALLAEAQPTLVATAAERGVTIGAASIAAASTAHHPATAPAAATGNTMPADRPTAAPAPAPSSAQPGADQQSRSPSQPPPHAPQRPRPAAPRHADLSAGDDDSVAASTRIA